MTTFGPPRQRHGDLDQLYRDAARAQRELASVVADAAEFEGGEAVVPGELKERGRAVEKIRADYGGDASYITDLARAQIVCDDFRQLQAVWSRIKAEARVVHVKDRFAAPGAMGYRDFTAKLVMSNGHVAELRLHLRPFWEADRLLGHKLYEQVRRIDAHAVDRELSPEERAHRRHLADAHRRLFDDVATDMGLKRPAVERRADAAPTAAPETPRETPRPAVAAFRL